MPSDSPNAAARPSRALRLTLVATVLGSSIGFLDATFLNVALPRITTDLHLGLADEQWVNVSYMLALTASYLLAGAIGDRHGQRKVFLAGTTAFAIASLVAGLAHSATPLLAARVAQGIAGAFLSATSLALLRVTWAEQSGRAIGLWSSGTSLATVLGPFVGGFVTDHGSWRWLFLVNLPVAAVTIAVAMAGRDCGVDETPAPAQGRLDVTGALLGAAALSGITWLLVQGPANGWSAAAPIGVAGVVCLGAMLWWERRTAHPVLPLHLFRIRDFTAANLATFLIYAGLGGSMFYVGLYLQSAAIHFSATVAGVLSLPVSVLMIALAGRFGRVADRHGPRLLLTVGPLIMSMGMATFALVAGRSDLPLVLVAMTVFGVGLCMLVAPITATALQSVPDSVAGMAAAINTALARFGQVVAVAGMGVILAAAFHPGSSGSGPVLSRDGRGASVQRADRHAFRLALILPIGLTIAGALAAAIGVSSRRTAPPADPAKEEPQVE
jgi:EmrB/QacA subfamily drug resistance transporter